MNWKSIPWVLGVALLAISLVAARMLNADTPPNAGAGGNPPAQKQPTPLNGFTILGTADSNQPVSRIDSPGVIGMPALTILKVLVEDGDKVEPGQVLVEFDAGALPHKVTQAKKQLIAAQWKVAEAEAQKADHPNKMELQKLALDTAEKQAKHADDVLARYKTELERVLQAETKALTGKPLSEEDKERRRNTDQDLNKLTAMVTETKANVEKQKIELKRLEAVPVNAPLQQANAVVEQIQAGIAEAEAMVESFKLKAQVAGTVEQLAAVPGMTFGATTRTPLMYIVPAGKRVIRAEVEAEFAHRIDSQKGKTVTICDQHDTTHTYTGVVRSVGGAFLPKRYDNSMLGGGTRVLECTIEVTDATPAGKPPLRPGQAVRVVFGQ